mmetsp:Transcript_11633/g.14502  ORF Transcript_11633/g.14502 Transcript_11633/m.14502 type:complete len:401 (-) Transcript_11633:1711-2913(-)
MFLVRAASSKAKEWLWESKKDEDRDCCLVDKNQPVDKDKNVVLVRKYSADSNPQDSEKSSIVVLPLKHAIDEKVQKQKVRSRDGLDLNCFVIPGKDYGTGKGKVMLLCSPLGFSNIYVFRPIIAKYGDEYTYINWQYRSLFESDTPNRLRRCSIRDHAEDALDVLKGLTFDHADVMVGHSMGVSVCTEFALLYPQHVTSIVMVNGSHGQVFSTAFQPFVRIPFVGNISEYIVKTLLENNPKRTMEVIKKIGTSKPIVKALNFIGRVTGTQLMLDVQGEGFYNEWITMYFGGLSRDEKSAESYCRLFQELHAHSAYHLLHLIENRCLLVSGGLDYLTPHYLMKEMSKQLPNAEYHCCTLSTHLTLMENPDFVLEKMDDFLKKNENLPKLRCDSMCCIQTKE